MVYLYSSDSIPEGFRFPASFLQYVSQGEIPYLKPWWFLCKFQKQADFWLAEIKKQYPSRKLVPFAKRSGSDDVACFDAFSGSDEPIVHYVHAYASPGWEDRGSVACFQEWLTEVEAESAEYKTENAS